MSNQSPDHTTKDSGSEAGAGFALSIEAVEGRLLAQRKVLALILAPMLQQAGGRDLRDALDTLSVMQDHQEDPGAILGAGAVIEGAIANEVRAIVLAASRAQSTMKTG